MLAIGLMSGTSLDGVDVALVEINSEKKNASATFILKDFLTLDYDKNLKNKIKRNLDNETAKLKEICSLNFELAYIFVDAINLLLKKNNLIYSDIEFVSSHGQTIWHEPNPTEDNVASTLQIGSAQVISTITGIKVISNFRESDVILGGQGAPLVPMFEYLYFKDDTKNIILQNIGGIGNLTFLRKNSSIDEVIAFDTGPGNVMIDYFMNKYYMKSYDEDGKIADSGIIIKPLFDELLKDEYIYQNPPKSTGREQYSASFMEKLIASFELDKYDKQDIITTITEFTVYSIVYNYKTFIKDFDKVIISGGGAHNRYIVRRLEEELKCEVLTSSQAGLNSDAKEAFAFAVLGYLSLNGINGNVKSATGAKFATILGQMTLQKRIETNKK